MASLQERTGSAPATTGSGPKRGPWSLVKETLREAWEDRIFGLSAEAGFWQLFSLPPLLLAVIGIIGFFGEDLPSGTISKIEDFVLGGARQVIAPDAVRTLIRPSLHELLTNGRADVVSIAFVLSLWSGSSAVATYVNTITIAYDMRDVRSAVRSRLLALVIYLGAVATGVIMLPLLVVGPDAIVAWSPTDYRGAVGTLVRILYWPTAAGVSVLLLATLYHVSVPVRTSWRRALPGSVLAMVLWVAGSFGLRLYITHVFSRQSVYGSLASPVAVLLFFYITAFAVLLGAELNAEIDKMWPTGDTARARARRGGARQDTGRENISGSTGPSGEAT